MVVPYLLVTLTAYVCMASDYDYLIDEIHFSHQTCGNFYVMSMNIGLIRFGGQLQQKLLFISMTVSLTNLVLHIHHKVL